MTILYSIIFIACFPFVVCYALYNAIRERISNWRWKDVRYEITEAGKLHTRIATPEDLAAKRAYRMTDPMPRV